MNGLSVIHLTRESGHRFVDSTGAIDAIWPHDIEGLATRFQSAEADAVVIIDDVSGLRPEAVQLLKTYIRLGEPRRFVVTGDRAVADGGVIVGLAEAAHQTATVVQLQPLDVGAVEELIRLRRIEAERSPQEIVRLTGGNPRLVSLLVGCSSPDDDPLLRSAISGTLRGSGIDDRVLGAIALVGAVEVHDHDVFSRRLGIDRDSWSESVRYHLSTGVLVEESGQETTIRVRSPLVRRRLADTVPHFERDLLVEWAADHVGCSSPNSRRTPALSLTEHEPGTRLQDAAIAAADDRRRAWSLIASAGSNHQSEAPTTTSLRASLVDPVDTAIVDAVADGMTNIEIAQHVHLSPNTIRNRLNRRYGVRNRASLVTAVRAESNQPLGV